nr:protein ACCELERATED CELL DEATH 6-like isoform X2 [Populus alba]
MTTTNISPTSIVVEALRGDNYDDWSACMKSYMLAQDLWDFIEHTGHHEGDQEVDSKPIIDHQEVDSKAFRKKNAAALHAIQISCAPHILSKIRSITSAKVAWDTLANLQRQYSPSHKEQSVEAEPAEDDESQGSGSVSYEINGPLLHLYKYAHKGDWDATKNYLSQYPNAKKAKIKPYGGTALHVAASAGNLTIVEELVKMMSREELEIQDDEGTTALFSAATVGITKMAECLVVKNKNLVTFVNEDGKIPLVEACIRNHKDMALYLYSVTPFEFLCQGNGNHGSYFLQCAMVLQMLDIAFDFLHRYPYLAATTDQVLKTNGLMYLSKMPETFPSEDRLAFWQQWIYSCIPMQSITTTDDNIVRINMPDQILSESKNIIFQVSSKLRGFAINLLAFLGIKQIYDLKKIHIYSDKILRCMCEYISTLDYEQYLKADVHGAFHNAVRNGMVEFITEVIKACPHIMISGDDNSRNLFMSSIANRQEKVFSLFYGLEASRAGFVSLVDSSGNTLLHLAAKLSPPSQLARISGAALQMQRELQWYKEVESIMNPILKDYPNESTQTARELFTSDHKDLLVKGEQWMKEAATSCTVVGALIITIMFTAAFTVPGGNVQETGYPIFRDEKSFTVFIVADAISLFSSSTSVLMFLGILTSRYAEEDFLKSLPKKLIIGLSTLFFSIATMTVTFCAALIIMLDGRLQIIIPIVLLAAIPVTFFMMLQFPLLVEIFVSTYGPGIFNRKMKRWY